MRLISNLPDQEHVPYKIISQDLPDTKTLLKYFRPSDYLLATSVGFGIPYGLAALESRSPTVHPRLFRKILFLQVPFFLGGGLLLGAQNVIFRFWGWRENAREVTKWEKENGPLSFDSLQSKPWEEEQW